MLKKLEQQILYDLSIMLISDQSCARAPIIPNSVQTRIGQEVIYHCDDGFVFTDSPATSEKRFPCLCDWNDANSISCAGNVSIITSLMNSNLFLKSYFNHL